MRVSLSNEVNRNQIGKRLRRDVVNVIGEIFKFTFRNSFTLMRKEKENIFQIKNIRNKISPFSQKTNHDNPISNDINKQNNFTYKSELSTVGKMDNKINVRNTEYY